MKRIAIITETYVRDAQVFTENPEIMYEDPDWENHFTDVGRPCLYLGIYEGVDKDEIAIKAASSAGVHQDCISLIPFGNAAGSNNTNEPYVCPVCENGEHEADAKCCVICGYNIPVNKVFYNGTDILLTPKQLAEEAGFNFEEADYPDRISGRGHCECKNGGEFDLLPKNHPAVAESGGKRYMRCRKCGCVSHL